MPEHLAPALDLLQDYETTPFEFVFSVPPRHGKSTLLFHFIVWALWRDAALRIGYLTYAQDFATLQASEARAIAERVGLRLRRCTRSVWETEEGGYVHWLGVNSAVTGKGYTLLLVDDPVKNRAEAESPTLRERTWGLFASDLYTRRQKGGRSRNVPPSVAVVQTRWHDDDLAGRLSKGDERERRPAWLTLNIPAIANEDVEHPESEQALAPRLVSLEQLHQTRTTVGIYAWSSLYQGRPRPRGSTVFGEPTFFVKLPFQHRVAQGLDLSYTEKKLSDFSVVVTMLEWDGLYYVVRVRREQMRAPDFKSVLREERARAPLARCRIYAAGTELGALDFMRKADIEMVQGQPVRRPGLRLEVLPPFGDKFTRAIDLAAAWNRGEVLVPDASLAAAHPSDYGWLNQYLDEMRAFTGLNDAHDDVVDASVGAFDVLHSRTEGFRTRAALGTPKTGRRM